jgi:hypothetical protein
MGTLKTPRITICRAGVKIKAASSSKQMATRARRKMDIGVPGMGGSGRGGVQATAAAGLT